MTPYQVGYEAKKFANHPLDWNPYKVTPWAAKEWERGWRDAE